MKESFSKAGEGIKAIVVEINSIQDKSNYTNYQVFKLLNEDNPGKSLVFGTHVNRVPKGVTIIDEKLIEQIGSQEELLQIVTDKSYE